MAAGKPLLYVVDSSIIISHLLPDESLPRSIESIIEKFVRHQADFVAPVLLRYEIGNVLKSAVKQKRLSPEDAQRIYSTFQDSDIHYLSPNYPNTLQISLEHNLSFYDASYLCLAREKHAKLLTLDKKLSTLSLRTK